MIDKELTSEDHTAREDFSLSRRRFLTQGLLCGLGAVTVLVGAACGGGQDEDEGDSQQQEGGGND